MTANLSVSLYEYFLRNKDDEFYTQFGLKNAPIPQQVSHGLIYSMRQPVKNLSDIKLNNDFAALPVQLELFESFEVALPFFNQKFTRLKNSLEPFGALYFFKICVNLPFTIPKLLVDFLSDKYTLVFSNLNCSKIPFEFDGKKQTGGFYFVPCVGKLNCGVSLVTAGKIMAMACFSDESSIRNPQEFVDIFHSHYKKTIQSYKF